MSWFENGGGGYIRQMIDILNLDVEHGAEWLLTAPEVHGSNTAIGSAADGAAGPR